MQISFSQRIDAPIEVVFDCVDDDEKIRQWIPEVVEITYPDGEDRANPIGTRFKQKLKEGGRIAEYDGEVIAYDKPRHLGITLGNPSFQVEVHYRLSPVGDAATQLDYDCQLSFAGWFYRLMGFLFFWLTKSIVRKQMAALKRLAETGEATTK